MEKPLKHNIAKVNLKQAEPCRSPFPNPYLTLYRLELSHTTLDGKTSQSYPYDGVVRKWLDAVVVVPLLMADQQAPRLLLRSAIRPPLLIRSEGYVPLESEHDGVLWEFPAGLIEPGDEGTQGIMERARAELYEEAGYLLPRTRFKLMGPGSFVSAGVIPEKIYFVVARVTTKDAPVPPPGDGSPLELDATCRWVSLEEAVNYCDQGVIEDMKTELAIRRVSQQLDLDNTGALNNG